MLTVRKLDSYLRSKHRIVLGELSLECIKNTIGPVIQTRIKVSGRSVVTGRRMTVRVPIKELF
jgi:actin-like ATPase involved in cell morphogenesis